MADNTIKLIYNLRQNANENSTVYGKWFPYVKRRGTLSLRGLSDHIASHGSIYTPDVVQGVLKKFTSCMIELITQGVAVKLDGFGTFYPTMEAKGAETPINYDINENLEGLHIRFNPEDADLDKISSRALAGKAQYQMNMIFDMYGVPKKVKNGQLVNYGEDDDDDGGEG